VVDVSAELNVYQPPKADEPPPSTALAKVYTPQQVAIASFVGGPLGGCLLLASNYAALGRRSARTQAIVWGAVGTVLVLALGLALPKNFPCQALPAAYTISLYQFAKTRQGPEYEARLVAAGHQSHWKAFGIGMASLVVLVAPIVVYFVLAGDAP
jgi:hypothetical protein